MDICFHILIETKIQPIHKRHNSNLTLFIPSSGQLVHTEGGFGGPSKFSKVNNYWRLKTREKQMGLRIFIMIKYEDSRGPRVIWPLHILWDSIEFFWVQLRFWLMGLGSPLGMNRVKRIAPESRQISIRSLNFRQNIIW